MTDDERQEQREQAQMRQRAELRLALSSAGWRFKTGASGLMEPADADLRAVTGASALFAAYDEGKVELKLFDELGVRSEITWNGFIDVRAVVTAASGVLAHLGKVAAAEAAER